MRTTGHMMKFGLAAVLLPTLAQEARGDLVELGARFDASTSVWALILVPPRVTPFGVDLDLGPSYVVQQSSFGFADYAFVEGTPAEARSEWDTTITHSLEGYEFSTSLYSEGRAAGYSEQAAAETNSAATISMVFDRDTEIDVLLRIDYARGSLGNSGLGYAAGGFTVDGLTDAPGSEFMLEGPLEEEGFVEFSFRATAQAGEVFTLTSDGLTSYATISNRLWDGWVSLDMTASVQVVPAPGGLALLAPAGLIAAGRRRR